MAKNTAVGVQHDTLTMPEPASTSLFDALTTQSIVALSSGCASLEQINCKLNLIGSSISIYSKPVKGRSQLLISTKPGEKISLTSSDTEQGLTDLIQGVSELSHRLQRIKLRALPFILRGSHHIEEPKNARDGWDKKYYITSVMDVAASLRYRADDSETKPGRLPTPSDLILQLNRIIPEEHRIRESRFYNRTDSALCDHLLSEMRYPKKPRSEGEQATAKLVLDEARVIELALDDIAQAPLIPGLLREHAPHEKLLRSLWDRYRALVKQQAYLEERSSWFSPSYRESNLAQRGTIQSSEEMRTDYQRFSMNEMRDLEREINGILFPMNHKHVFSRNPETVIFGSGLAALEGVLSYLSDQVRFRRSHKGASKNPCILKSADIYFEVDYSISRFSERAGASLEVFDPAHTNKLADAVKTRWPLAVFIAPVSTMYGMKMLDVNALLMTLCDQAWHQSVHKTGRPLNDIYIVIDNTGASNLAAWKGFPFERLPNFVRIISFESLVKFTEDGLDLTAAGSVTCIGEFTASSIESIRKRSGLMPTEHSVRRLSYLTDRDQLNRKLVIHSRNTRIMLDGFEEICGPDGFLSEVRSPHASSHPQKQITGKILRDAVPLFNIGVNNSLFPHHQGDILSIRNTEQFMKSSAKALLNLVVELARHAEVEFLLGSSFGFGITRAATYSRGYELDQKKKGLDAPYIRIAPGTENVKDIKLILACFRRANEVFTDAIRKGQIEGLVEALEHRGWEMRFQGRGSKAT